MTLIFTNTELLELRGLPADTEVIRTGPTTGSERGSFDGVYIEIEDASIMCPDCGTDAVNLAMPPDVSIGCSKCGWEAVTARPVQLSPQVKQQLDLN